MKKLFKAAILGSTGYTGLELTNILCRHPRVSIEFLGSKSSAGLKINKFDSRLRNFSLPLLESNEKIHASKYDVVFLALPHKVSQKFIKNNIGSTLFIDLSADFRLDNETDYLENYESKHFCPQYLNKFIYGLPEINHSKIKKTNNIAVPGCYPTSILLPLIPLIKEKLIFTNNIIIDSKSGYSGAGKKFDVLQIKNKDKINFYNYNTNNHRHICEIKQELKKHTSSPVNFSFNPHVLPLFRGMMSTIYCDLKKNITKKNILISLQKKFFKKKFVKILKAKDNLDIYSVYQTNYCLIKFFDHFNDNKIIIVSAIDNLLKGASGQAVQCMNIRFGLNESTGLLNIYNE